MNHVAETNAAQRAFSFMEPKPMTRGEVYILRQIVNAGGSRHVDRLTFWHPATQSLLDRGFITRHPVSNRASRETITMAGAMALNYETGKGKRP